MKRISAVAALMILFILFSLAFAAPLRFHVDSSEHHSLSRHALTQTHERQVVRHNMRAFGHLKNNQLSHDKKALEDYYLNDMGYFFSINMTIGGLPYKLNIDTGSSDIFIKGENSPGNPVNKYSCQKCLEQNEKIILTYIDGPVNAYKTNLPVRLGSHTFTESILVAYTEPATFNKFDGLVGLSFPEQAVNKEPNFLQTLINNEIISDYAYGVNFNFQTPGRSIITFGQADKTLFEGTLRKYKIEDGFSFIVKDTGFKLSQSAATFNVQSGIFTTGNTCITIPDTFSSEILNAFNVGGNVCSYDVEPLTPKFSLLRCRVRNFFNLPTIIIVIEGDEYPVEKDSYISRCISSDDGDLCDLMIESLQFESRILVGDGFFNRYYTYFDVRRRKIGIAKNLERLSYKNTYKPATALTEQDKSFFSSLK